MKEGNTKQGPKTVRGPKAGEPASVPRPVIDPALLKDVGDFLDDPEAWFHTPNGEFEGRMPIELLGTPEEARSSGTASRRAKLGLFS